MAKMLITYIYSKLCFIKEATVIDSERDLIRWLVSSGRIIARFFVITAETKGVVRRPKGATP